MKNVLVFLAEGFEEMEAVIVIDVLRRAGVKVTMAAIGDTRMVTGSHGIPVMADTLVSELPGSVLELAYDLLVLPGGQPGTNNLRAHQHVKAWVAHQLKQEKWVAAICAAPLALAAAGVLSGRTFTSYPGVRGMLENEVSGTYDERRVVVDGKLVTSRGPGTAFEFALTLTELLVGKEKASELAEAMLVKMKNEE